MAQFFEFITTGFHGSGAPIMFMLVLIMFIGLGLIIERVWYLYFVCGSNASNQSFLNGVSKYVNSGEYEKAIKLAQGNNSPLSKVVAAILKNQGKGLKVVQRLVDEVFLQETPRVNRSLGFLQAFANMSVLIGLAGTIYGFMEAFDSLANVPAAQRAQALAASIAIVMSSTLWGLIGAIMCLLGHALLGNKAEKILAQMDEKAAKMINLLEG
jgi:biopolymer transport protein ExbB/TolQ